MNVGRLGGLDVRVRETEIKEKGWTDKIFFFFYPFNGSLLKCLEKEFIKLMLHH